MLLTQVPLFRQSHCLGIGEGLRVELVVEFIGSVVWLEVVFKGTGVVVVV